MDRCFSGKARYQFVIWRGEEVEEDKVNRGCIPDFYNLDLYIFFLKI